MLDFISNLTLFGIIGYSVMLLIIANAIGHWLEYLSMKKEMNSISSKSEDFICQLGKTDIKNWACFKIKNGKQNHPTAAALLRLLKAPDSLKDTKRCQRILELEIRERFSPLESSAERVKSASPAWGLFFTVVGVMLASADFAESASVIRMLGSVGPALGTTALGAIASIIEKNLIHAHLKPLQNELVINGERLFMDLASVYSNKQKVLNIGREKG